MGGGCGHLAIFVGGDQDSRKWDCRPIIITLFDIVVCSVCGDIIELSSGLFRQGLSTLHKLSMSAQFSSHSLALPFPSTSPLGKNPPLGNLLFNEHPLQCSSYDLAFITLSGIISRK